MNKDFIILLLSGCILAQFIFRFWKKRRNDKKLDELIAYVTAIQDEFDLPQMQEITEGRLAILQSEIYKVLTLLKQSYAVEHKQKTYMVDMLSDISHQIKTPLAAISIMTELLESPVISEQERLDYVGKIDSQITKITWLVKNLLTLSRLEADVLQLKQEKVLLSDLFGRLKDNLTILADIKDIRLEWEVREDIYLVCDRHWTEEAVSNIIKNAIEHTQSGGMVKVWTKQNNVATYLYVKDNGAGMTKEQLSHVFERFYQTDFSSADSVGIGLAMAKQIIMKQNGVISAQSEEGVGTEFIIKLYKESTL